MRGPFHTLPVSFLAALACCGGSVTGASEVTTSPTTTTPSTTVPRMTTTTTPTPERFAATVSAIDDVTAARMEASWRPGCPVPLEGLSLLTLSYLGFDGAVHKGELVVGNDVADDVVRAFAGLFDSGYPFERMELVDVFGADDDRSTMANNTSAFNCRPITGGTSWSEHSYGTAIDINPVQNPYVSGGRVLDPDAIAYLDRSLSEPGMIHDGDAVVGAFAAIGWEWGGHWSDPVDYQHFSATGR